MTATPTPGDLSARHAATLQTMIHQSDDGAICICAECRALKAAIAALSALPAAGGPRLPDRKCVSGNPLKDDFYKARQRDYVNGWDDCLNEVARLNTTPQPSAAEANKTCGVCGSHRIRKPPKGTECMDCRTIHHHHAAVGTQGDGLRNVYLRDMEDTLRQLHAIVGLESPDVDALIEKVRHLAAPSKVEPCGPPDVAGKGVDDAMVERALAHRAWQEDGVIWPDAYSYEEQRMERRAMRKVLAAALNTAATPTDGGEG